MATPVDWTQGVEVDQFAPEAGPYDSPETQAARGHATLGKTVRVRITRGSDRFVAYLSKAEVLQLAEQLIEKVL